MIALVDYGSGNLRSVEKALAQVGGEPRRFQSDEGMQEADGLVLPGVGAFDDCILALKNQGLIEPILEFIKSGKPFLGICVGYQALFERSEEFQSSQPGLGVFKGVVKRFPSNQGIKIPQIGWNQIQILKSDCPLYQGIPDGSYTYFVHSYHPEPEDPSIAATETTYGVTFASSVWKDNVFATQFHPEKSQQVGLKILENFVGLAGAKNH